jgi:hypothetical protein
VSRAHPLRGKAAGKSRQTSLPLDLPRRRHTGVTLTDAEYRQLRSQATLAGLTLVSYLTALARQTLK